MDEVLGSASASRRGLPGGGVPLETGKPRRARGGRATGAAGASDSRYDAHRSASDSRRSRLEDERDSPRDESGAFSVARGGGGQTLLMRPESAQERERADAAPKAPARGDRHPERVCPTCGTVLLERKCKLICPDFF